MAKILIVDDQPMVLKCLKSALLADQHDVSTVTAADMALRLVGYIPFDLIITDYSMPRMDGLKFLEIAQERCPGIPVIMITGYGTAETAIEAMAKGAFDYLTKPFSLDALRSTVMAAQEYVRARKSIGSLTRPGPADLPYCNIVAASAVMKDVCKRISEFARQDCPVLLGGEPGTGKEIVARTIHANSPRKAESFAVIDCTAVSGSVAEELSVLEPGTVLFKGIDRLQRLRQDELLAIMQSKLYQPPGDRALCCLNQRIIATSERSHGELANSESVNRLLFELFAKSSVTIPPLRERAEDVRAHVGLFLRSMEGKSSESAPIEPEALMVLERHPWPGNLHELNDVLRNAVTMACGARISLAHLPREVVGLNSAQKAIQQRPDLNQFRGRVVKTFLKDMKNEYRELITKIDDYEG